MSLHRTEMFGSGSVLATCLLTNEAAVSYHNYLLR